MNYPTLSILTPTTGKETLYKLIESIDNQNISVNFEHILLWDAKREGDFLYPDSNLKVKDPYCFNSDNRYSIVIPGNFVQGPACGSSLRAVGMMAAKNDFITFGDDDVFFEPDHFSKLLKAVEGHEWAYTKRRMWTSKMECLGIDDFESVGDSPNRKVSYEMVDNNCMMVSRRFATSAAVLYRETKNMGDDRLMYAFLKQYAGIPGKVNEVTVNHICPERLEVMFKEYCTKEIK